MIYLTGFADEAANALKDQIRATRELGWSCIESRNIDGVNIHDLDEKAFDRAAAMLDEAGIRVNCFGSTVANWAHDPFSEADFQATKADLARALVRMRRLKCRMIRGMSFVMQKQRHPDDAEVESQVFPKVRELVKMCADAGVDYLHENCMNYGGQSPEHSLRLLDAVNMPNFKLLFDTGNPVFTDLRHGDAPYRRQTSLDFYRAIRPHIGYVHIKDGVYLGESAGLFANAIFTYPGEGNGDTVHIVNDLIAGGYAGGISIEPHMALVFHDADAGSKEEIRYRTYVEYGRRLQKIVENACKLAGKSPESVIGRF